MGGRGGSPNPGPQAPTAARAAASEVSNEQTVRSIYNEILASYPDDSAGWILIPDMRERLDALGWSREKQDDVFRELSSKVNFVPQSNRKTMKPRQKENFFVQGNERKDWMNFVG
jgi:hypothetical protein